MPRTTPTPTSLPLPNFRLPLITKAKAKAQAQLRTQSQRNTGGVGQGGGASLRPGGEMPLMVTVTGAGWGEANGNYELLYDPRGDTPWGGATPRL